MSEQNLITFIDHIGRTILATLVDQDKNSLTVKNPAIIHVQPTQQGQLNVQTIPLFFREFVGEKSRTEGTVWKFNLATVVLGIDIDNDPRLVEQYVRLFSAAPIAQPATGGTNEQVIKLFDE
jgi:hypothetical protein